MRRGVETSWVVVAPEPVLEPFTSVADFSGERRSGLSESGDWGVIWPEGGGKVTGSIMESERPKRSW